MYNENKEELHYVFGGIKISKWCFYFVFRITSEKEAGCRACCYDSAEVAIAGLKAMHMLQDVQQMRLLGPASRRKLPEAVAEAAGRQSAPCLGRLRKCQATAAAMFMAVGRHTGHGERDEATQRPSQGLTN